MWICSGQRKHSGRAAIQKFFLGAYLLFCHFFEEKAIGFPLFYVLTCTGVNDRKQNGSKEREVKLKQWFRGSEIKAGHDMVVRLALITRQLSTAVGKREHLHLLVKTLFIRSMASLDLAVVSWCGNADALVLNAHV